MMRETGNSHASSCKASWEGGDELAINEQLMRQALTFIDDKHLRS